MATCAVPARGRRGGVGGVVVLECKAYTMSPPPLTTYDVREEADGGDLRLCRERLQLLGGVQRPAGRAGLAAGRVSVQGAATAATGSGSGDSSH